MGFRLPKDFGRRIWVIWAAPPSIWIINIARGVWVPAIKEGGQILKVKTGAEKNGGFSTGVCVEILSWLFCWPSSEDTLSPTFGKSVWFISGQWGRRAAGLWGTGLRRRTPIARMKVPGSKAIAATAERAKRLE
jgi:hypothetical protein